MLYYNRCLMKYQVFGENFLTLQITRCKLLLYTKKPPGSLPGGLWILKSVCFIQIQHIP
jgi:hypothetical protein